jgi:drug/metabolite transporter (DMT)-like permease
MTMTKNTRDALIRLHFIVFIWGFTGILGYEISLPPVQLVWWRVLIAAAGIGVYALFTRKSLRAGLRDFLVFSFVGLITAAHWICFFGSIKISNISTALAVLSTTSFFVAFIAPAIRRERFQYYELVLGVFIILGLTLIFRFEPEYTGGILLSLCAALFAALFSSINSILVTRHPPHLIAFYEMIGGFIALSLYLSATGEWMSDFRWPDAWDGLLLLILGLLATAYAFIAGIQVMKVLSPFTCAITINLEPVYTILFALLLYGEKEFMSVQFYFGALILLSTLFADAYLKRRRNNKAAMETK